MTEDGLKDKIKQWLSLKGEADTLEKAREDKLVDPKSRESFRDSKRGFSGHDELNSQMMGEHQPGVSHVGIEARRADAKVPENKVVAHGYARVGSPSMHKERAKSQHQRILAHLKSTKPNLPKSELDKSHEQGVHKPFAPGPGAAGISSQGYTVRGAMRTVGTDQGQEFRQPQGGPNYDRELARDKSKKILTQLKSMPKPNLPKSELDKGSGMNLSAAEKPFHEDIVAGVALPMKLKDHSGPVPHDHPHREIAAKFVTDVWRKNRNEGERMSNKYLGNPMKKTQPQPAIVSEPTIMTTQATTSEPRTIESPNTINGYGVQPIVNFLKGKKK